MAYGAEASMKLAADRLNALLPDWGASRKANPRPERGPGSDAVRPPDPLSDELGAAAATFKDEMKAARPLVGVDAFEVSVTLTYTRTVFAASEEAAENFVEALDLEEIFHRVDRADCRREVTSRNLAGAARDAVSRRPKDGPPVFGDLAFTDGRHSYELDPTMPVRMQLNPAPHDHETTCPAYVAASWTAVKQEPIGPCSCVLLHLQEAVK